MSWPPLLLDEYEAGRDWCDWCGDGHPSDECQHVSPFEKNRVTELRDEELP